jgi:hypothetical protein
VTLGFAVGVRARRCERRGGGAAPGALPPSTLLGPRPPPLPDYLDDAVAAGVRLPATQKVVLIQAVELETLR